MFWRNKTRREGEHSQSSWSDEKTNGVVLESESLELGSELGEKASIDELLRAPGKKRGQERFQLRAS